MHVQDSTGAAFALHWRPRLMRLLCLAAFSNALVPGIDGTAPQSQQFAIARQFAPLNVLC
jgi:hypothetical protein